MVDIINNPGWINAMLLLVTIALLIRLLKPKTDLSSTNIEHAIREEMRAGREEQMQNAKALREEIAATQKSSLDSMMQRMADMARQQQEQLLAFEKRIQSFGEANEQRFEKIRQTLDQQLASLQQSNEQKLEQMRATVDEKLQGTLNKRLGEAFEAVNKNLESVHQGLGEMKTLAHGVGDLKRVLTNVKTRGTWGEFQLAAILEQILTPEQYAANVQVKEDSREHVEFAIKLPGASDVPNSQIWLPIDSKFPKEDYERLVIASEAADADSVLVASKALLRSIRDSAKEIAGKYIDPPNTTDFAMLFLPTEGLYAEALRESGFVESIQREYRVVITGPTTLSATLNSLRMGFRTLAIEKRSSEVWNVLAAVKTEFGKFGDVLDKVKRQLDTAAKSIDQTGVRTRAMERKLSSVERMDDSDSANILGISNTLPITDSED